MIIIRNMIIEDYNKVYHLWLNTPGMGLNTTDDSEEGVGKFLKRNPNTTFGKRWDLRLEKI